MTAQWRCGVTARAYERQFLSWANRYRRDGAGRSTVETSRLHSKPLPGLAHFGQALPVLIVLIRLLAAIFRIKLNALPIFENLNLHAFRSDHLLVARGIGDITDDHSVELAHVDQRGTNVAGTECRKNR